MGEKHSEEDETLNNGAIDEGNGEPIVFSKEDNGDRTGYKTFKEKMTKLKTSMKMHWKIVSIATILIIGIIIGISLIAAFSSKKVEPIVTEPGNPTTPVNPTEPKEPEQISQAHPPVQHIQPGSSDVKPGSITDVVFTVPKESVLPAKPMNVSLEKNRFILASVQFVLSCPMINNLIMNTDWKYVDAPYCHMLKKSIEKLFDNRIDTVTIQQLVNRLHESREEIFLDAQNKDIPVKSTSVQVMVEHIFNKIQQETGVNLCGRRITENVCCNTCESCETTSLYQDEFRFPLGVEGASIVDVVTKTESTMSLLVDPEDRCKHCRMAEGKTINTTVSDFQNIILIRIPRTRFGNEDEIMTDEVEIPQSLEVEGKKYRHVSTVDLYIEQKLLEETALAAGRDAYGETPAKYEEIKYHVTSGLRKGGWRNLDKESIKLTEEVRKSTTAVLLAYERIEINP